MTYSGRPDLTRRSTLAVSMEPCANGETYWCRLWIKTDLLPSGKLRDEMVAELYLNLEDYSEGEVFKMLLKKWMREG